SGAVASAGSLQFDDVQEQVQAYLERDPDRHGVQVAASLSPDRRLVTLTCHQTTRLALGGLFGRSHVSHTATSTARAVVLG
ncbi:MAG: hypothetical protein INR72_18480, partial [Williamsia herbipolensis]|nr:hypothetical protein [Williamsia herbipolensis]